MHKKVVKIADREKDATKLEKQVYLENTILQALTKFHRLVLDGRILAIGQESLQQMSRISIRNSNCSEPELVHCGIFGLYFVIGKTI